MPTTAPTAIAVIGIDIGKNSFHIAILMLLDSPGGQVSGINAFADIVAAGRNKKCTTAFVAGSAASAAYWIASAASEIAMERTGMVGSSAFVRGCAAQELVGGIAQTDSKIVMSPTEITRSGWPGPNSSATKLLITADCVGSNGVRVRLWKCELQALADELGIAITVCRRPEPASGTRSSIACSRSSRRTGVESRNQSEKSRLEAHWH